MTARKIIAVLLAAAAQATVAEEWRFETAADAPKIVSCLVDAKWTKLMEKRELVAVDGSGGKVPVRWVLDTSGPQPELVWETKGYSRFSLRRRLRQTLSSPTDLTVDTAGAKILVGNSFFALSHPTEGGGGFPGNIRFVKSGDLDGGISFMDRFVRKNASGASDVLRVAEDGISSAKLVFSSPLRAVVEVKAKVADIEAVYRYVYSAYSPVIRIDTACIQREGRVCSEAWTVAAGWTRSSPRYQAYMTNSDDAARPFQPKGRPSRAFAGRWAAVTDGTNAVAMASVFGASGWDASSSFVYYLLAQRDAWRTLSLDRSALVYLGPMTGRDGFDREFAGVRPVVKVFRGDLEWVPTDPLEVAESATLLEGGGIRIAFDSARRGYNCIGIENAINKDPAAFCVSRPGCASFWSLTFWKDSSPADTLTVDNLVPANRALERRGEALVFHWRNITLGDERDAADVCAEVKLTDGGAAAEWRLSVANRSRRWGLAETRYPQLRNVVKPRRADVLVPKGNWGGRLTRSYQSGADFLRYPNSVGAQAQTCAFMLGGSGLQVTALDGKGQEKTFEMSGLDLGIRYRCPDEGVPGAARAPDFAVETASFSGDWWRAAKRYRAWALRQKWTAKGPLALRSDFNRRLGNIGFWLKADGDPGHISNVVSRAEAALPGIPLGLHWYCWHYGPFDHYYPEIFPERKGMKETVAWLKKKGVTVMPYINGRLWDSGIASYSEAFAYACKQPDGTVRLEEYGSGRKFAPMCPTAKPWRRTMEALYDRLVGEIGVNAVYFDQVAASRPAPCHDASHAHAPGGGSFWTEGYRELMKPIRAKSVGGDVSLTTENAAEPYMDSFDAHLTWFGHGAEDIPLLPAVYSGYTVYFGSCESEKDSLDSYCAQQARDFLWGCQGGWNDPWILDGGHKEHLRFSERLSRERIAHKDFFLEGELMRELSASADTPTVEVRWLRRGNYCENSPFRMPAVIGAEWRDFNGGRRYRVFVNISGLTLTFSCKEFANGKPVTISPRGVVSEVR